MKSIFTACISILIIYNSCTHRQRKYSDTQNEKPYVIMLSMDGFRWDYPEKTNTPNLDYIESIGVRADAIIPCFPTKTFPNHFSMATGLYPDNHGIIFNNFFATGLDKYYSLGDSTAVTNPDFYSGEPIWVTAEKQNVKSASFFWVGSEAYHENILPSYYYPYDSSIPFENRIDSVVKWLKLPEKERPHLILWYINEPDSKGHDVGPDRPALIPMIEYLDSLVGVFTSKIASLPNSNQINIILTSDHGMSSISRDRSVYLFDLIQKEWCQYIDGGNPVYSIEPKDEYYDTIYNILSNTEHIKIWKKNKIPENLNFGVNKRVKNFVVVADSSWSIWKSSKEISYEGGAHGYENTNKDMHAIFYAYGPAFKSNFKYHAVNNIDLYPLICEILKITPQKVDGDLKNIVEILKK